jgi:putative flavoprotein involved in K+ transport
MADKVGKVWGLGSGTIKDPGPWEGELRNMWKPTAQEGLWFHGGNLALSRYYSLYLALQLKARMEGIPTPVYQRAAVHHTE